MYFYLNRALKKISTSTAMKYLHSVPLPNQTDPLTNTHIYEFCQDKVEIIIINKQYKCKMAWVRKSEQVDNIHSRHLLHSLFVLYVCMCLVQFVHCFFFTLSNTSVQIVHGGIATHDNRNKSIVRRRFSVYVEKKMANFVCCTFCIAQLFF